MKRNTGLFKGTFYETAVSVIEKLREHGHSAFLVGGCVRDALLQLEPEEFDITTAATPAQVQDIFTKTVAIGESFGVVLVIKNDFKLEIATFRKERDYHDGRRPSDVRYSDNEKDDVIRRDFTINGLLFDPIKNKLHDYVGGKNDLEKKIIRTIGNPIVRFEEDKLRMMRAVRFASRFNFEIDEKTFEAIKKLSRKIVEVSSERIRDEIIKIITQKNPGRGLNLLHKTDLLKHTVSEVNDMVGVPQPPQFHPEGDVFVHTCLILDKLYEITDGNYSPELAMGALLHDIGKPPTYEKSDRIRFNGHDKVGAKMGKQICKNLKFSNKQTERIVSLIKEHLKFKDAVKMKESTLKRFVSIPYFEEHLTMHLADCLASHEITDAYDYIIDKLKEFQTEDIRPKPFINGYDLIKMGFTPGPIFTKILSEVEEQQLEGIIKNKKQAIAFVKNNYSPNN